ncbi:uncharacterized protein LOC132303923 isoform X2 [Cornus florida]|uniref:uncharacterized protein LOC132303923 isoform X2 n=1 Tax=Cornus florida TaxID=4283 RepID=UPI0028A23FC1|nr:uncharacterized protein LOC132303923 isoform X2 [Cornus florida]XP_059657361.1 uncharacterized protein LOC132303923 isoform X2 [Cornus florida]
MEKTTSICCVQNARKLFKSHGKDQLNMLCSKRKNSLEDAKFPVLNKLKRLELKIGAIDGVDLLVFAPLIECPFLSKFVFQLEWCESTRKLKHSMFTSQPHQYLKVVEIIGFVGLTSDVELAMYLIKSAINLETITCDSRQPLLIGTPWEFMETKGKRVARKHAKKLGTKLPLEQLW